MTESPNKQRSKAVKIGRVFLKILLWSIAIPVTLFIIVIIALQFQAVQLYVTEKATTYLSKKINSKVTLHRVDLVFPKMIALTDVYIEDQAKDTLLYANTLRVDVDLMALMSNQVDIKKIELETFTGHIKRDAADFNYDFIVKAFAGDEKVPVEKDSTSTPWKISLRAISLKNIYLTYHDKISGTNADLHLGALAVKLDDFDLDKKKIHVKSIELQKTQVALLFLPVKKTTDTTQSDFDFELAFKQINLSEIKASYKNAGSGQNLDLDLGKFYLKVNKIDLQRKKINLQEIVLSDTKIVYRIDKNKSGQVPPLENMTQTPVANLEKDDSWTLSLNNIDLENNSLVYDDKNHSAQKSGIDYNHISASGIIVHAQDLSLDDDKISAQFNRVSLKEKSGFEIKNLSTKVACGPQSAGLSDLKLQTGDSRIKGHVAISYPSIEAISKDIGELALDVAFDQTSVGVSDVLYFVPALFNDTIFNGKQNTALKLDGKINGTLDDLKFRDLTLHTLQNTSVHLNGSVKHIREPENMYLRLEHFAVNGSEKDLYTVVSKKYIPPSIKIPAGFNFSGSLTGYLKNFNATIDGKTTIGNLSAKVKMNPASGNTEQPYEVIVKLDKFDPGKLLNQTELLGPVTLSASVKGSGFDINKMNADLDVHVISAVFKKYNYKELLVKGQLKDQAFTGKININDPNVAFDYDGTISLDPARPNYVFTVDLKGADLKALNLSDEDFRVSAVIQSDIQDRTDKNFTGKASIKNALIIRDNKKYPLDSLVFSSESKDGISQISLRSEILTADFKGDITLNQLPAALQKHVNNYFTMQTLPAEKLNAQKFDFEVKLVDPSLLTRNLIPNLETLSPFTFKGTFDSEAKKLEVKGDVPQVIYSGVKTDSLKLEIGSDVQQLNYKLGIVELSNTTFKFENLGLKGDLKNNALSFQFNTNKDDSAKTIAIGGLLSEKNGTYILKINQDLYLNAEKWNVDPANSLEFRPAGLLANQMIISKGNSSLGLNSVDKSAEQALEIKFKEFELSTFSKLIENNNELASGKMNGNVILEKHNGASGFKSDLVIDDFKFKTVPIGKIQLKADNIESAQKYAVDMRVDGNGNEINLRGAYLATDKDNTLNFLLDIDNLNLATIEPFTFGQVTRMSGALKGKLTLKGSASAPDINGDLYFKESAFRPRIIDSYLTIHDGKMNFNSKKINFNNILIYDSLNNKASVNGYVNVSDLKNLNFDLQVKTVNFLALNTKRKDNPLYFGRVFLDSDVRLKGTTDAPDIDVKAKLNKGSFITYVKPETEVGKNDSKGIVEFTDSLYHPGIMTRTNDTLKINSEIKGITLKASINFDRAVELKMLVDQESGDSLYILGGGKLDFEMDKTGKTSLTGKYSINDGGYHLAISDVVKRNFKIEKGSSVTWSGDVLEPYVDLKAIYVIKTSPIDLVQDELSGMTELERNKYRNLLTFYVYLKMTGFISQPDISFDIQLAPDDRGALNGSINSKLGQLREDETELNKQVFALLTLRRFIGENPLDNGNDGGGLSSASRSSASKVLTQQLSSLSDKYVNFVDLDLGVNSFEDYSSGVEEGRTQLQVGVSKQLLNDKVTIRVGGNVELEGERARQNNANDVAGNISIDYKLTEDGRYKLKAFRENQYENPIEGELTKTGAGIMYVRNFKRFKELLKKPVKRKTAIVIDDKSEKEKNKKNKSQIISEV